jgi:hypothetical protein
MGISRITYPDFSAISRLGRISCVIAIELPRLEEINVRSELAVSPQRLTAGHQ